MILLLVLEATSKPQKVNAGLVIRDDPGNLDKKRTRCSEYLSSGLNFAGCAVRVTAPQCGQASSSVYASHEEHLQRIILL